MKAIMRKRVIFIVISLLCVLPLQSCKLVKLCKEYFKTDGNGAEEVDPAYAKIGLKNLSVGMRTYSAVNGGGGEISFTKDITEIEKFVMKDVFLAIQGGNTVPYHGYLFKLEERPNGDDFRTNFSFIAFPAEGFKGKQFSIDKTEVIEEL